MKTIDVKNQPRMGFARIMGLTVNGIRYRLFRSSVTVVVIAVAIAFLMNVLSEGLLKGAVRRMTSRRIAEDRRAAVWAARLSVTGTIEGIIAEVAEARPDDAAWKEAARMGGLESKDMKSFNGLAGQAAAYLRFFRDLEYADRRVLVRQADGIEIFDRLQVPLELENTKREMKNMKSVRFVTSMEEFEAFLKNWRTLGKYTAAVLKGREAAIAEIARKLAGKSVIAGLADAEGSFGDDIRAAKFDFEKAQAPVVAEQARQLLDVRFIEETSANTEIRRRVSAYLDVMPAQVNALVLWNLLENRSASLWYLERLKGNKLDAGQLGGARAMEVWPRGVPGDMSLADVLRTAVRSGAGDAELVAAAGRAGISREDLGSFVGKAKVALPYLDFFRGLAAESRKKLVGDAEGTGIFSALGEAGALDAMKAEMEKMGSVRLPGTPAEFGAFLGGWPEMEKTASRLAALHDGAVRPFRVERITTLAKMKADDLSLANADRIVADSGGGMLGIGERMTWLTLVAMLVCVVGVANAMLMSVTERFREIATLKCLGALDGSIMGLFVLEASLLGVVGGVAGAIAGSLIGLGRMLTLFGWLIVPAFPAGDLVVAIAVSTGMGVVLAAVAAVYPSFRAARLAPMEAMRIQ